MRAIESGKFFVDTLRPCLQSARWRYDRVSHLFTLPPASNITELKRFAEKLGLKPFWFQWRQKSLPHFDLSPGIYARALALGAELVDDKFMIEVLHKWRESENENRHI